MVVVLGEWCHGECVVGWLGAYRDFCFCIMRVSQEAFFDNADSLVNSLRFIRFAYNAINCTQNSISRSRCT